MTARLVGAALMGIGLESMLGSNASAETFRAMLNLKIIWSLSAIFAISAALFEGAPAMGWVFLAIFVVFCAVWVSYRVRLGGGSSLREA
jgi:apolipoprotein N-acyltransferase